MYSWLVYISVFLFLSNFHSVLRQNDLHTLYDNDELSRKAFLSRENSQRLYYSFFLKEEFIIFTLI